MVSIYNTWVQFPSPRTRKLQISQKGPGAKNCFFLCMVSDAHFMCFGRPRHLVWEGIIWKPFCAVFGASRQRLEKFMKMLST